MRMPTALRSLDDRILGDRGRRREAGAEHATHDEHEPYPDEPRERTTARDAEPAEQRPRGDGFKKFLAVFARVSRAVFLLLALIVVLGIIVILAPTNSDNVLVESISQLSETVAGPFRDVFTAQDADRETVINYGLAAGVYLIAAALVGKLAPSTR